jgi:hypothetical protein
MGARARARVLVLVAAAVLFAEGRAQLRPNGMASTTEDEDARLGSKHIPAPQIPRQPGLSYRGQQCAPTSSASRLVAARAPPPPPAAPPPHPTYLRLARHVINASNCCSR